MKKIYSSVLIMLLLVSVFTQERIVRGQIFEEVLPRVGQMYYIQGEFLVKFKPKVSEQTIDTLNSVHGVSSVYTSPYAGFRRMRVPAGKTVAGMVEIYQASASVDYAEANYIAYALKAPNDELYSHQWHLHNASYGGIKAEPAWNISTGSGVVVAILDTGIAYEDYSEKNPAGSNISYEKAPDLANTLFVPGYDFVNHDKHPNDDSVSGHGTHIAGTVAQNTQNGIGTAGVAFDAYLMPVKVLNKSGAGTYADIAEGIIWATDNGAHVINIGLGGTEPSLVLEQALAYAYNSGLTIIAAAGNDGIGGVCFPAAYDDYVIAVGAICYDETLAYYSSHGASLDLTAPGGNLKVDRNGDAFGDGILQQTYKILGDGTISWGYSFMEGTSMAAAHVSGIAALLIANGNAASPEEVRQALESTAKDMGEEGWDIRYGFGIVDAFAALQWTTADAEPKLGAQPLDADFSGGPTVGLTGTTVQFTDQSTGDITSWSWDFGDGGGSSDQNPSHTYSNEGAYTVSLTVTDLNGSDTETSEAFIEIYTARRPIANFNRAPVNPDDPMVVQFVDDSSCGAYLTTEINGITQTTSVDALPLGGITSWRWDFGDGALANERDASHTYSFPGTYTVSLTVTGPGGSDTKIKDNYIQFASPVPIADFTATPRSGNSPLVVQFTGTSTGDITSRLWNFGDGTTSTQQNPSHTYGSAGTYTVSLTVTGLSGSNTKTMEDYIQVTLSVPAPIANFTAAPRSGSIPLVVQFTSTSTGEITSRLWNFGDGTTSTEKNPVHTYQKIGSYTVSLTVVGPGGSDTKTLETFIQVTHPALAPVANFTAAPRSGSIPLVVQFTSTSTGEITSWLWNFSDGTTSTEKNPVHTYQKIGSYTVSLTVVGPGGSNTKTLEGFIQVTSSAPVADFTAEPRSGDGPLLVKFTDTSTGNISSRLWDFGDGTTSTEQNPVHTYTFKGTGDFTVSLTVTGLDGTDTETKKNYIRLNTPPVKTNIRLWKKNVFRSWYQAYAELTVTQNDPKGLPLAGATVEGTWNGGYGGTVSFSRVTDENGEISLTTEWAEEGSTVTFIINKVIIGGKEQDFAGTKSASIMM
ncbi:MAG: PKD domain-containing protein [Planctomycetes bacterium]|nr:PKD domain-containing protein [Planctomycetota bacterium]